MLYITHESKEIAGATLSLFNLIHSVEEWVRPIVLLDKEDVVYDFFQSQGVECVVFPFKRVLYNYGPLKRFLFYVPRLLRDSFSNVKCCNYIKGRFNNEIDIVHSNSSVVSLGEHLSKSLGVKHVWHVREFLDKDFHFHPFGGMRRLRHKINKADACIAITSQIARHWEMDGENAHVIWDAVRKENEICAYLPKDKFFLFCSARLSDGKGANTAVEAFCKSGLSDEGFQLIMVGNYDETYKQKLMSIVNSYSDEILHNIEFVGFQKDIKGMMQHASAFLMCSLHEGLGRVTIEAMCYGCPVIARKTGGTLDFLKDRETGYFFNNTDECAELLKEVSKMPMPVTIYKANDFFRHYFTEEVYGRKILNIYQHL